MTQDEMWEARYIKYASFIKTNGRCPSKHRQDECNPHSWYNNRKLMNAFGLKPYRTLPTAALAQHDNT